MVDNDGAAWGTDELRFSARASMGRRADGARYWRAVTRTKPQVHVWSGWGERESDEVRDRVAEALDANPQARAALNRRALGRVPRRVKALRSAVVDLLTATDEAALLKVYGLLLELAGDATCATRR